MEVARMSSDDANETTSGDQETPTLEESRRLAAALNEAHDQAAKDAAGERPRRLEREARECDQ